MDTTPKIRDLQTLIAEQQAALQPQQSILDQQITANDTSGAAQVAGLGAQQTQAFKGIEQTAQNKGMFFSGFSPAEQANYTSTTYLPALAQLQATIASGRSQLMGKKADLNYGAFEKATAQRESDLQVLNQWNTMTAQQKFNASEAEKERAFTAQQNQIKMANDNNNVAKPTQIFSANLSEYTGGDGFVSPGTYKSLKNQWVSGGYGTAADYDANFAMYRNPYTNDKKDGATRSKTDYGVGK